MLGVRAMHGLPMLAGSPIMTSHMATSSAAAPHADIPLASAKSESPHRHSMDDFMHLCLAVLGTLALVAAAFAVVFGRATVAAFRRVTGRWAAGRSPPAWARVTLLQLCISRT